MGSVFKCNANPCCGDPYYCVVPLPQDKTGLPHLNKEKENSKAKRT